MGHQGYQDRYYRVTSTTGGSYAEPVVTLTASSHHTSFSIPITVHDDSKPVTTSYYAADSDNDSGDDASGTITVHTTDGGPSPWALQNPWRSEFHSEFDARTYSVTESAPEPPTTSAFAVADAGSEWTLPLTATHSHISISTVGDGSIYSDYEYDDDDGLYTDTSLFNGREFNIDQDEYRLVYVPCGDRYMVKRVALSDGSCLFHAVAFVTQNRLGKAQTLRHRVVRYLKQHPNVYSEAVLGMPLEDYCRWILHPKHWGGALELGIFSELFQLEIMSVDVRDHHIDYYGKGRYPERVFLLYTGSHYDAVGLAADYNDPFEYDQTIFPAHNPSYVSAAVRLSTKVGA